MGTSRPSARGNEWRLNHAGTLLALCALLSGCGKPTDYPLVEATPNSTPTKTVESPKNDAEQKLAVERGHNAFHTYGCWHCHTIGDEEAPGIHNELAMGPDMADVGSRGCRRLPCRGPWPIHCECQGLPRRRWCGNASNRRCEKHCAPVPRRAFARRRFSGTRPFWWVSNSESPRPMDSRLACRTRKAARTKPAVFRRGSVATRYPLRLADSCPS